MKINKIFFSLVIVTSPLLADSNFILVGDTGRDNSGQLKVSESIQKLCLKEKCEYGMLAGDNVYSEGVSSSTDPILERMFDKYYNALNIPFIVALGNHDYGNNGNTWVRGSYQLLHAKKNPLFILPDYFYTYETPDAVIAVIDTPRIIHKTDRDKQALMVANAYQKSLETKKWFFVMGHHPFLSNGDHGNAGNYERLPYPPHISGSRFKSFMEEYVCGKAHLYLSGHDHNLQVFDGNLEKCNTQLIVSGAGCEAKKVSNRNKADFAAGVLGYFHLNVTPNEIRARVYNSKTEQLFEKRYLKK